MLHLYRDLNQGQWSKRYLEYYVAKTHGRQDFTDTRIGDDVAGAGMFVLRTGTVQKARHQARAGDEISGRIVSSASRPALDSAEATDEEAMAALRQAKYKQASRRSWSSRSSRPSRSRRAPSRARCPTCCPT